MARNKKASLIKKIHNRGGYVPEKATVGELQILAENIKHGDGWVIRVHRPPQEPFPSLDKGQTYWVPNSRFAVDLVQTRLVFTIQRISEPPKGVVYLPIPPNWGIEEEE